MKAKSSTHSRGRTAKTRSEGARQSKRPGKADGGGAGGDESEDDDDFDMRAADGIVEEEMMRTVKTKTMEKKKKKKEKEGEEEEREMCGTERGNGVKRGEKPYARLLRAPTRNAVDVSLSRASSSARGEETKKWHALPERELTPALRRELRLLKLRSAADPKRFYKSNDSTKLPTRFHVGTVVAPAADFYSGRLLRANRSATFVGDALADTDAEASRRRRFAEIQARRARLVTNKRRRAEMTKGGGGGGKRRR